MPRQITPGRAVSRLRFSAAAFAAGAALLAGGACAAQVSPQAPAPVARAVGDGPALWVVRDTDSIIYLYGTIHLLKPGTAWGSAKVDAAFDSASEVWFEVTDPDDMAALTPLIQQYAMSPARPLSSWLTPDEQAAMDRAATALGMNPRQIDPTRPWFAAMTIATGPLNAAGFDPAQGVELNLRARAQAAGKSIHGFETIDQQLGGLARMSDEGQMTYLRHYLKTWDTASADLDRAVAGWIAGDETVMAAYARDHGRAISEETHQVFLARRNADWADQIETRLKGSGVSFIAVGNGHLVGEDSVQDFLAARGIAVSRD